VDRQARPAQAAIGGTGWTLQGEAFPTAVRGQAAAIAATVDWLATFALIEVHSAGAGPKMVNGGDAAPAGLRRAFGRN
jgi:hypothetical protein